MPAGRAATCRATHYTFAPLHHHTARAPTPHLFTPAHHHLPVLRTRTHTCVAAHLRTARTVRLPPAAIGQCRTLAFWRTFLNTADAHLRHNALFILASVYSCPPLLSGPSRISTAFYGRSDIRGLGLHFAAVHTLIILVGSLHFTQITPLLRIYIRQRLGYSRAFFLHFVLAPVRPHAPPRRYLQDYITATHGV